MHAKVFSLQIFQYFSQIATEGMHLCFSFYIYLAVCLPHLLAGAMHCAEGECVTRSQCVGGGACSGWTV